jgi:hypothetical protein
LKFNLIRTFDTIEIINRPVSFSKLTIHPVNTNLFSARLGYIFILDNNLNIKVFESFDILKEYSIDPSDYAFELYKINGVLKVHPYPFSFETFYTICPICRDLANHPILQCSICKGGMCDSCNLFNDLVCDECNMDSISV